MKPIKKENYEMMLEHIDENPDMYEVLTGNGAHEPKAWEDLTDDDKEWLAQY